MIFNIGVIHRVVPSESCPEIEDGDCKQWDDDRKNNSPSRRDFLQERTMLFRIAHDGGVAFRDNRSRVPDRKGRVSKAAVLVWQTGRAVSPRRPFLAGGSLY